jgi:hypothetical protein
MAMRDIDSGSFRLVVAICLLGIPLASAPSAPAKAQSSLSGGSWSFSTADQDHPDLSYSNRGKTIFTAACGHAFVVRAVYPAGPKQVGVTTAIAIASAKREMSLQGEIDGRHLDGDQEQTAYFVQWDLGYGRQDPSLYEKRWRKIENELLELLDSERPLTVSAEGRSYVLPAIDVRGWRSRFQTIC